MRYKADIRTLVFVAIFFVLVEVQFLYQPAELWLAIPLWLATCVFSFLGAVATHNTIHAPIFHARWANKVMQVVLTLTYGHAVSSFVPGHNLSHHRFTQSRRDVMRTTKARFRWNLMNLLFFAASVGKSITQADIAYMKTMRTRHPRWFRQLIMELAILYAALAALLWIDWRAALLFVIVPHLFAKWGIITMNLLQHDGCDENSEYNHSRNFTGAVVNWFTYNNGYHTIHHEYPGLHWSKTPERHREEISPHIHPALEQKSLATYLWRTYVWPGTRMTYDGKPYVLPEEGPDEEWIPRPNETPDVSLGAEAMT